MDFKDDIALLTAKDNSLAYTVLKRLPSTSEKGGVIYPCFESFAAMLRSENSYIRTRDLRLTAKVITKTG